MPHITGTLSQRFAELVSKRMVDEMGLRSLILKKYVALKNTDALQRHRHLINGPLIDLHKLMSFARR